MSKIVNIKKYKCTECGELYNNKEDADDCCADCCSPGGFFFCGLGCGILIMLIFGVLFQWDSEFVSPDVLNGICKEQYGTSYTFYQMEGRNTISCQKAERIDGQDAYIKIFGGTE